MVILRNGSIYLKETIAQHGVALGLLQEAVRVPGSFLSAYLSLPQLRSLDVHCEKLQGPTPEDTLWDSAK